MSDQQRKIVFFLGAGASLGAGAYASVEGGGTLPIPTQSDFWDTFIRFSVSLNNKRTIERFLFKYFLGYSRFPGKLTPAQRRKRLVGIDVEEVFTFISERARAPSTSASMKSSCSKVWDALVQYLPNVFVRFGANTRTRALYKQLLNNHVRSWDTVVSFNYDVVFEESVPKKTGYFYPHLSRKLDGVRVLKPHGSINWSDESPVVIRDDPGRALVVAPTHLKFVQTSAKDNDVAGYLDHSDVLSSVWSDMEREMKSAKALVFIGYSFPVADLYFSSVLRSVLADRGGSPGIVIVNPDARAIRDRLQTRFTIPTAPLYYDVRSFSQAKRKDILGALGI